MAVLVFLVEFIAVVMISLFLALLAAMLMVVGKVLGFFLQIIAPITWLLIYATTKLGLVLQYNMDCFSALYKNPESVPGLSHPENAPGVSADMD